MVPTWPPVFRRIVSWTRVGQTDVATGDRIAHFQLRLLWTGWLQIAVGWCFMGLSLWATLRSLDAAQVHLFGQFPLYVAAVTLAVVAGFISLIPGGTIVREAVLMQLLMPQYGEGVALVATLLLRVVWLVSELSISSILYLLGDTWPPRLHLRYHPPT